MQHTLGKVLKHLAIWQVALACYWSALFVFTHIPLSGAPPLNFQWGDKVVHLVAFAILAALLATTWQVSSGRLNSSHLRWAWVALAFYGAIDEWTQSLVGRETSFWDWVCDAAGAFLGLAAFALVMHWKRRSTRAV
jgi:VanZ family protein